MMLHLGNSASNLLRSMQSPEHRLTPYHPLSNTLHLIPQSLYEADACFPNTMFVFLATRHNFLVLRLEQLVQIVLSLQTDHHAGYDIPHRSDQEHKTHILVSLFPEYTSEYEVQTAQ